MSQHSTNTRNDSFSSERSPARPPSPSPWSTAVGYKGMDATSYFVRANSSPTRMGRALSWAVTREDKQPEVKKFLTTKTPDYDEAIATAAKHGSFRAVKWLADNGASPKGIGRALFWAIRSYDQRMVDLLAGKRPDYDEAVAIAAQHCHHRAVEICVENGAGPVGVAWAYAWAVKRDHKEIIAFLESKGPDCDVAIALAARYGDLKSVLYLLRKGPGPKGMRQALYWALRREKQDMVDVLKGRMSAQARAKSAGLTH